MRRRAALEREISKRGSGGARMMRLNTEDIYETHTLAPERQDVTVLAASIARHGLLSPLVVRKNAQAGRYALVCGTRRLAACRLLGLKEVDALLLGGDEVDALACYFEEHWCRAPVSCLDEAEMMKRADAREIGSRLAVGGEPMLRRLRLLSLGQQVRRMARSGNLTLEQIEPLLMIPREDRQLEAAAIIAGRGLNGRQARRLVAGEKAGGSAPQSGGEISRAGKRRATPGALGEVSALCERLKAQGMDVNVSVRSQDGGICVRMMLGNGKILEGEQEKEKT